MCCDALDGAGEDVDLLRSEQQLDGLLVAEHPAALPIVIVLGIFGLFEVRIGVADGMYIGVADGMYIGVTDGMYIGVADGIFCAACVDLPALVWIASTRAF